LSGIWKSLVELVKNGQKRAKAGEGRRMIAKLLMAKAIQWWEFVGLAE
jgi:hypothetical protein